MISEYIEKQFSPFLQSKITFEINEKVIKKGRLILIAVRDFHIFFALQTDAGDHKQFIMPLPYGVQSCNDGTLVLDYTLERLALSDKDLLLKLRTTSRKKNTRFFDTKVHCKK